MAKLSQVLKSHGFSLLLITAVLLGCILGIVFKKDAAVLKPWGDIFLNLLFTAIVPLVFFSIAAAVAGMSNLKRLGRILSWMLLFFVLTGFIASSLMVIAVQFWPPSAAVALDLDTKVQINQLNTSELIVKAFTASDFTEILSKRNMLALIVFAILVGVAAAACGEKGKAFSDFLVAANEVMMKVIAYIMYYAPIGLCAYFAYFIGVYGSELMGSYFRAMLLYYPIAILYFFSGFSAYAYLAAKRRGLLTFWRNIIPPALTALATGSSVATIPANLAAANKTRIPRDISEVVIPIGATMHMDGSCLGAVLKIAFLFGMFHLDFTGPLTMLTAVGVAILAGTVITGIPGGGVIGDILIISLYGFPLEAFPLVAMIGALIDPPATMLNAVGDNVASMVVARMINGRDWMVAGGGD
jgi:Na+/H+-dicarboxylate symporter